MVTMKGHNVTIITNVWFLNIFIIVYTILDVEQIGNVELQSEITDMDKDMISYGYRHSNINEVIMV